MGSIWWQKSLTWELACGLFMWHAAPMCYEAVLMHTAALMKIFTSNGFCTASTSIYPQYEIKWVKKQLVAWFLSYSYPTVVAANMTRWSYITCSSNVPDYFTKNFKITEADGKRLCSWHVWADMLRDPDRVKDYKAELQTFALACSIHSCLFQASAHAGMFWQVKYTASIHESWCTTPSDTVKFKHVCYSNT